MSVEDHRVCDLQVMCHERWVIEQGERAAFKASPLESNRAFCSSLGEIAHPCTEITQQKLDWGPPGTTAPR